MTQPSGLQKAFLPEHQDSWLATAGSLTLCAALPTIPFAVWAIKNAVPFNAADLAGFLRSPYRFGSLAGAGIVILGREVGLKRLASLPGKPDDKLKEENEKLKKELEEAKKPNQELETLQQENQRLTKELEEAKQPNPELETLRKELEEAKQPNPELETLRKELEEAKQPNPELETLQQENQRLAKELEEAKKPNPELETLQQENQRLAKVEEDSKKLIKEALEKQEELTKLHSNEKERLDQEYNKIWKQLQETEPFRNAQALSQNEKLLLEALALRKEEPSFVEKVQNALAEDPIDE